MNSGNWRVGDVPTWIFPVFGSLGSLSRRAGEGTEGWGGHSGGSGQGCRQPGKSHLPSEIREWRALCLPEIREQRSASPKFGNSSAPAAPSKGRRPKTRIWPGFGAVWCKTRARAGVFLGQPRGGIAEFQAGLGWNPKRSTGRGGLHREGDAEHGGSSGSSKAAKFLRGLRAQIQLLDVQIQTIPDAASITS